MPIHLFKMRCISGGKSFSSLYQLIELPLCQSLQVSAALTSSGPAATLKPLTSRQNNKHASFSNRITAALVNMMKSSYEMTRSPQMAT